MSSLIDEKLHHYSTTKDQYIFKENTIITVIIIIINFHLKV